MPLPLPTLQLVKLVLAGLAIAGAWWVHRSLARGASLDRRQHVALAALAVLSAGAYVDFGQYPKFGQFANPHDLFHYYLGSKYSREVGYYDLYPAVIVAAADEHDGVPQHRKLRKMRDYRYASAKSALDRAEKLRKKFGPRRWRELRADVRVFEGLLKHRFGGVVRDMGYNATPVWNSFARVVTNIVPARSAGWLAAIDLLLLVLAAWALARAFGPHVGLLWLVAIGTCFCMSYTHIRGALLRLDWLVALVVAVAALRRERFALAGALVGWATMSRIFPVIFLAGVAGWAFWRWREDRRIPRGFFLVAGGFGLTVLALFLLTVWDDGGLGVWRDFIQKIRLHDRHIAPIRVGFKYLFLGIHSVPGGDFWAMRRAKIARFHDLAPAWWAIQAAIVGVSIWATRRLPVHQAFAIVGYVPVFFLVAPTFYYHVVTMVPMAALLTRLDDRRHLFGVTGLFALSIALFAVNQGVKLGIALAYTMSCLLLGLCAMLIWIARGEVPADKSSTPGVR